MSEQATPATTPHEGRTPNGRFAPGNKGGPGNPFARRVAGLLEAKHPDLVLSKMERKLRKGKVFVDWSQNDDKKTTVTVYSLRAKERPTVSTPLTWDEVKKAVKAKKKLSFETDEVLKRVKKRGDLFAPVLTLKQKLPPLKALETLKR